MKNLDWVKAKCTVSISVITIVPVVARAVFIYIFMVSAGDFSFVRNSEVSVIAGCPQGRS